MMSSSDDRIEEKLDMRVQPRTVILAVTYLIASGALLATTLAISSLPNS